MSEASVLEAQGITFAYDREPVVSDVSLAVARGEMVGIIGPNGAGKSTLLALLTGCLQPQSGEIVLEGKPLHDWRPERLARRIAVVPQAAPIAFGHLVADIVAMGRHPHRSPLAWGLSEQDRDRVLQAMETTDTLRLARRRYNALSGGEQQRVLVARALAQSTEIMLLDEPTASLDLHHQAEVVRVLRGLHAGGDSTIAWVAHDLNLVGRLCTRLVLMDEGRIAAEGSPSEVLTANRLSDVYRTDVMVSADERGRIRVEIEMPEDSHVG